MRTKEQNLKGWGNFPQESASVYRPESESDLSEIIQLHKENEKENETNEANRTSLLSRGLGRSYADTALNAEQFLIDHSRLNRFLVFDESKAQLTLEAGVSLREILEVFVPRGYFLPVVPGTKEVTVGGAIANDIHGKNHHQYGSFASCVVSLELLLVNGEKILCSPTENSDYFYSTLAGLGLTGIINTATLQLKKINSPYIKVDYEKTKNLEETFASFEKNDSDYEYSVAWLDCIAKSKNRGRCVLMRGNWDDSEKQLEIKTKKAKSIPMFPAFLLNNWSMKVFNKFYYALAKSKSDILLDYNSYFFPLDSLKNWNTFYGKRGFTQFQCVFPIEASYEGINQLLLAIKEHRQASFLTVLKKMGPSNQAWLSFPQAGYTVTFDFKINKGTQKFIHRLQDICLDFGGRVYLAKDAYLDSDRFFKMYDQVEKFMEFKNQIDPKHIFSSSLARRVGLL